MLKTAIVNVLRKNCLLVAGILMASGIAQYWRDHDVSFSMLFLVLFSALAAGLLVGIPVELHRLRNAR